MLHDSARRPRQGVRHFSGCIAHQLTRGIELFGAQRPEPTLLPNVPRSELPR
jgi:hypothetical protein